MRNALLVLLVACGGHSSTTADAPASTDTWASWAMGFTQTYCSATCHAPGGSGVGASGQFDFTQYANVYANRAAIRCGVAAVALAGCTGSPAPKQFPIAAPYPSDPERARLVAWIDAGAAM